MRSSGVTIDTVISSIGTCRRRRNSSILYGLSFSHDEIDLDEQLPMNEIHHPALTRRASQGIGVAVEFRLEELGDPFGICQGKLQPISISRVKRGVA